MNIKVATKYWMWVDVSSGSIDKVAYVKVELEVNKSEFNPTIGQEDLIRIMRNIRDKRSKLISWNKVNRLPMKLLWEGYAKKRVNTIKDANKFKEKVMKELHKFIDELHSKLVDFVLESTIASSWQGEETEELEI